ncbi:hypothetical protein G7Y89_g7946 [Cudoniella acicularis]|uniref:Uncharacterized protein n=1 Tax=Cudoniella acicularis TaxID=354080 RepID=A0A8H4W3B6_9HELO|nr:hypothetical protein G7Y89_g7946 [Cudoniella acicularis]
MPTFSFLKASRREGNHVDQHDSPVILNHNPDPNHEPEDPEKAQRRQSRRDFFRALIKKPIATTESKQSRWRGQSLKKPSPLELQSPRSPDHPSTPMSDTNKPLPPPPPGTTQDEAPPTPKPATKLARIISPIATGELQKLFSGAPQFFARSEGHHTGPPHPSVAYPWNTEVEIRDLCDHVQIQDEAWGGVTAWPHITWSVSRNAEQAKEHHRKQRAHFMPRCRERPNMLSMQGLERGTMGYGAALEMGVADALRAVDDIRETSPEAVLEHRKKFLNDKEGLRPLTDSTLIERLLSVSTTYHEDPMKHRRPTVELYTELFTQILYPPSRVTDSHDPYSLQVQIEALIDVLRAPFVWVDFGLVEWRIRLGQILWGSSEPVADEEITVNNEVMPESGTQKYWLLLQILLSCELLLRLDAVSMNIDHGLEAPKPAELRRFDKSATSSVRWSIILARQWLEHIRIEKLDPADIIEKKTSPGWLATLTGGSGDVPKVVESIDHLKFRGRNQATQISGLVHFARKLGWPDIENLNTKIVANGISVSDTVQNISAAGTPLSMSTQSSTSYFPSRRHKARRGLLSQKGVAGIIHPSGWLSNSYLSGLILPGEVLGHLLMSTLLENDVLAVARLGDEVNLYGGFVYSKKSFWSTACVIGRVLAAKKGAHECMSWISSDVIPRGAPEGWVDIDVELPTQNDPDTQGGKPRIWHKTLIETDGNVIGGADISSVLPGDFVIPSDESFQKPFSIVFESLDLFSAVDSDTSSVQETPTPLTEPTNSSRIQTYSAMMRFMIESSEAKREINLALAHDVHFVTAHPCVPSPYTDILRTPTSPSFQISDQSSFRSAKASGNHPLHKAFTYTRTPILDLLFTSATIQFSALLSPPSSPDPTHSSIHTTNSTIPKVLVIDCTDMTTANSPPRPTTTAQAGHKHSFGNDLEMLARAFCAERGWNALISRRGRGCVSCAVREAGALGWRVVLRLA